MNNQVTLYVLPAHIQYVEQSTNFEEFEITDKIDYDVPTIIFINDSKYTRLRKFSVVYQGMQYDTGGGASTYNPVNKRNKNNDYINSSLGKYYPFPKMYSSNTIWEMILYIKIDLFRVMPQFKEDFSFYYLFSNKLYITKQFGILAGIIDMIGMGKLDIKTFYLQSHKYGCNGKQPLLLIANAL